MRTSRIDRGHPIEAVAAQIHQPTAVFEVLLDTGLYRAGVVLRVTAGEHHLVGRQQVAARAMQILVRDDVVRESARFEPADQVQIGGEVARRVLQSPGPVFRAHIQNRPQARGVADAAPVAVHVVQ